MSIQHKPYQKFVATAATAALVATAVVPVASANSTAFTDVGERYKEAVTYLVDNNITNGVSATKFGTTQVIKRVDVAVLLAKTVLTEKEIASAPNAGFTDVPARAKAYVNGLKAKSIINGKTATTFGAEASITRGEAALMLAKAYGIKGNTDNVKFTDVSPRYKEAVAALVDNGITSGKTDTKFGTDASITRGELAIFLHKLEMLGKAESDVVTVSSVNAVNAKTITVTFSAPVDAKTLKNASGVEVITVAAGKDANNAGKVSQELSADGKTLTLTAKNFFEGEYTVKVPFETVKGTNGKFVSPVNQKVTVNDTVAPVLTSVNTTVKATTEKLTSVTLTFDEDVATIETVKIGNENYTPVVTGKTATITVNLDATKAYDVTVVKATDFAGNVKALQTAPLTITVDDVAPSITGVVAVDETSVKVTLDEEVKGNKLVLTGKVGAFTANIVSDVKVNPLNKKEYIVTLNSDYLYKNSNADTVTLTAAKGALVDAIGNTNAADVKESVVVTKDTVAPAVTNVETSVTNGKVTAFTVTYSKEVTSLNAGKIKVVNSKGEILSLADVATPAINDDAKKVVFTLKSGLKADQYSFDLAEGFVTDKSLAANKSAKFDFEVDVTDATKPVETTFTIVGATEDKNVVTVNFGAKVKATGTGSALTPAAYQVNGVVLPADTKIEFAKVNGNVDQSVVVITLPAGFVKADDTKAVFQVTGVETLDNKVNKAFTKTIAITDNTAPEAKSFDATELKEITVTYSEVLAPLAGTAIIEDEVKLFDSKGASIAIKGFKVEADKLVLTVDNAADVSKITTVETKTTDILDVALNAQKTGITLTK
ncbi:S-layer homology domain-containing protein [Sporosarcina sp. NPDC096371]|uniref:S-layer homology domain-containing protein n=1 Tax=Sporosarcina sp. NPDC096371 TaxID=3364530 RepID=UPI00380EC002